MINSIIPFLRILITPLILPNFGRRHVKTPMICFYYLTITAARLVMIKLSLNLQSTIFKLYVLCCRLGRNTGAAVSDALRNVTEFISRTAVDDFIGVRFFLYFLWVGRGFGSFIRSFDCTRSYGSPHYLVRPQIKGHADINVYWMVYCVPTTYNKII